MSEYEDHARQRKAFSHAFSEQGLRAQEPKIKSHIDLFNSGLRRGAKNGPQDLVKWYTWITFDIIGDLSFGESFNCVAHEETHEWVATLHEAYRLLKYSNFAAMYHLVPLFRYLTPPQLIDKRRQAYFYARGQVEKRMQYGAKRGDFWDVSPDFSRRP